MLLLYQVLIQFKDDQVFLDKFCCLCARNVVKHLSHIKAAQNHNSIFRALVKFSLGPQTRTNFPCPKAYMTIALKKGSLIGKKNCQNLYQDELSTALSSSQAVIELTRGIKSTQVIERC